MKKLVFGMPTLIELDGLEANVALCSQLGLDFVELNMNQPEYQVETLDVTLLKKLSSQYGVGYTLHLPEALDVASFSEGIRNAWLNTVAEAIDLAKVLNVPVINMHMHEGIHFKLPNEKVYLYEKYQANYMSAMAQFALLAEERLKNSDVRLAIENTGIFHMPHIIAAVEALMKLDFVDMTWDIGHDHSCEGRDKVLLKKYQDQDQVKHMHIHDAIGEKNHLTLYTGELDLDAMLSFAQNSGSRCVIETKSVAALETSVVRLKAKGWL